MAVRSVFPQHMTPVRMHVSYTDTILWEAWEWKLRSEYFLVCQPSVHLCSDQSITSTTQPPLMHELTDQFVTSATQPPLMHELTDQFITSTTQPPLMHGLTDQSIALTAQPTV